MSKEINWHMSTANYKKIDFFQTYLYKLQNIKQSLFNTSPLKTVRIHYVWKFRSLFY